MLHFDLKTPRFKGLYIHDVGKEGVGVNRVLDFLDDAEGEGIFENLDVPSLLYTFFACKSLRSNANGSVAFQKFIHHESAQHIL